MRNIMSKRLNIYIHYVKKVGFFFYSVEKISILETKFNITSEVYPHIAFKFYNFMERYDSHKKKDDCANKLSDINI